ncbi:MAG: helix-turn-helix domain-containing protein [Alphaproteobacteria bacterium]
MELAWIDASAFAEAAGITARPARFALSRAHAGHPWRKHNLIVRTVRGKGGKSGVQYQVRVDSLPAPLQDAWHAQALVPVVDDSPVQIVSQHSKTAHWRYGVIEDALQHPARTAERSETIERLSRKSVAWPSGRYATVSAKSIRRWIRDYEAGGMAGLRDRQRSDKGASRVFISRTWSDGVPFDDATKARIAETVQRKTRSFFAENLSIGWQWIARFANETLYEETLDAGYDTDKRRLRAICTVSRPFVEAARPYREIAIYDKDRKRHFDRSAPRIKRSRDGRLPMDIVVGDVHPIDILLPRPGGGTFTPKLVAWYDLATNRFFFWPVFLKKGEGVRQEHVVESVIAMALHPEWGMPQNLYLDNGGEYNWAGLIDDAMQLNTTIRHLDSDPELAKIFRARSSAIIKARPYNAPAKAIEGGFGVLEGGVFSMLPGWIGGNRMKKKTANVGREPKPYPHGEHRFREDLANALAAYETTPQSGFLAGLSPRQKFAEAVEAGWQRMDIEETALRAVFARTVSRKVSQGAFTLNNVSYTSREIQRLPAGTQIYIRVPVSGDLSQLAVCDRHEKYIGLAVPDVAFDILDPAGAREAAKRQSVNRRAINEMRGDVDPVDMRAELKRLAERADAAPVPESAGTIRLSDTMRAIGRDMAATPGERKAIERAQAEADRQAFRDASDKFLGKSKNRRAAR